jgi:hypothetical protein
VFGGIYTYFAYSLFLFQDLLGVELMGLIDDPQAATIHQLANEAAALQPQHQDMLPQSTQSSSATLRLTGTSGGPSWIAPAPVAIKMRIFCLPYAGGVSENIFSR